MKKRRKEHLSGDVDEEIHSIGSNDDTDEEDIVFIPERGKRRKRFLLFLIIGIISIVNVCFFIFSWELSQKYSMINSTLRKLDMCRNQLKNVGDIYETKMEENKKGSSKDHSLETIRKLYEIGSIENEDLGSDEKGSRYNPTNSVHLNRVIELLVRNNYYQTNLPGEIKIAIADLLWRHQKEDHLLVDVPKPDKWMGYFNIFPPTITCDTLIRVGSTGDGGKFVCNLHKLIGKKKKSEAVRIYSFGVHDDISFDLHLSQMIDNYDIHLFDPTVNYEEENYHNPPESRPFTYHQTGLGPIDYGIKNLEALELLVSKLMMMGKDIKLLDEIADSLSHEYIDILKIDIEYAEYTCMKYIFENNLLERYNVKLVLIEYHAPFSFSQELDIIRTKGEYTDDPPPPNTLFKMRKNHLFPFLERFYENGFYMYSSEPNTRFLRGIEYGFVHRSLIP